MPRARREWTDILAEIRRMLREETAATSFWTDAMLLDFFNQSVDLRSMQLANANEGWVTDPDVQNIVSGTKEYPLAEGTGRVKRVVLVRTLGQGTIETPLVRDEKWDTVAVHSNASIGGSGWVPTYRLIGEEVWLSPTPRENITNGLRIEFEAAPARLTTGTDKLPLSWPDVAETVLIYDAVMLAYGTESTQDNSKDSYITTIERFWALYDREWREYIEYRQGGGQIGGRPAYYGD